MAPRGTRTRGLAAVALVALVAASCDRDSSRGAPSPEQSRLASGPTGWVKIYDPGRAANGYTLALHRRRQPVIIDMNGRSVHAWPEARVKSRITLLPNGSLLGLALGRSVVEYDWDGNLVWRYKASPDLPHHDVIRLENGNTMFPILPEAGGTDEILEVDRAGNVVWRWDAGKHLKEFLGKRPARRQRDITHINSVRELPDNRLSQSGDNRFRPGNLLISARNLDRIFVIDRTSGKVVWSFGNQLDLQHEATMVPAGYPGEGNILLFDNGFRNTHRYRKSRIVEIDPGDSSVVWEYVSDDFYSHTAGIQQPLANGNILIGSSRGGRIFEIDRMGTIHWQWTPPFEPVRPSRYEWDHCPQLAALGRPESVAIQASADYRHVDWPVYTFVPDAKQRRSRLERTVQTVLADNNDCHEILLPTKPRLRVSYGVARRRVAAAGRSSYAARFSLLYRLRDTETWTRLLEDTVDLESEPRREFNSTLDGLDYQWIELCVETSEVGATLEVPTEEFAFWIAPKIAPGGTANLTSTDDPATDDLMGDLTGDPTGDLTEEELEVRLRHLEALGYVN